MEKKFFKKALNGVLMLALLCAGGVGLAACSSKDATLANGQVEKIESFNTSELNLNAQAAVAGLKSIEAIPEVSAYLAKNPKIASDFDSALGHVSTIATAVQNSTGGSVSIDVGTNWTNSIAQDITVALGVVDPIVADVAPKYEHYVSLVQTLVPVIQALTSTFGEPAPAATSGYGATAVSPAQLRQQINMGAVAYAASYH